MQIRPLIFAGLALGALGVVSACDSNDGPLENAGETIDNKVEETADAVEDTADEAPN